MYLGFKAKRILLPMIIVLGLGSFAANIWYIDKNPSAVFYLPMFRFWEILVGTYLAYLNFYKHDSFLVRLDSLSANVRASIGLFFIVLGIIILDAHKLFPGYWALLPVVGTFLIISSGQNSYINKKILSHPKLVSLGLISYPLYLWHWPILSFIRIWKGREPSFIQATLAVVLSLTLAKLTFQYLEKPLKSSHFKFKTFFLTTGLVACGVLGWLIFDLDGLPDRYPEEIRAIARISDPYEYFNYEKSISRWKCHKPDASIPLSEKEEKCIDKKRPLIFLWGDSYAASLYPGLIELQKRKELGIAQFTSGNAPPFLSITKETVEPGGLTVSEIAKQNLYLINKYLPEKVILHWMYSNKNKLPLAESITAIKETIASIKKISPRTEILLIGPVPHWDVFLNQVYLKYWNINEELLPEYTKFGLNTKFLEWDSALSKASLESSVTYISPYKTFCNENGCLTRTGDSPKDLTAVDWGHLTTAASIYFINKIEEHLE
jgi:hypothetical protein